jgi:uncharacterized membrane protein
MLRFTIFLIFLAIFGLFSVPTYGQNSIPGSVNNTIETEGSVTFPSEEELGPASGEPIPVADEFFRGRIIRILSESEMSTYGPGSETFVQELEAELLTGPERGTLVTLHSEAPLLEKNMKRFEVGDQIVIGKALIADEVQYYLNDVYRLNSLWIVCALFIFITLALTRFHGIRAFLGLIVSFLIIGWFIVPYILAGYHPLLISFVGTTAIAATSIYIAHGFHRRTTLALAGTLISIVLALIFSYVFVTITKLFGLGSEEAFYLQFAPGASINLQGLLLGGIIIGVLGILDDITTAQTAVVEQIYHANPTFDAKELYTRASKVGREHILSLVNTLVLAYTGASLPLILIFRVYERPAWITLNSEIIMEEVIRMLIGSITLIITVPITTFIAARYYSKHKPPHDTTDTAHHHAHIH